RTTQQRNAQGLCDIAQTVLNSGTHLASAAVRPHLSVTVEYETLKRLLNTSGAVSGGAVSGGPGGLAASDANGHAGSGHGGRASARGGAASGAGIVNGGAGFGVSGGVGLFDVANPVDLTREPALSDGATLTG